MDKLISLLEYVLRFDKPIGFYADQLDYYEGQSNAMSYVLSYTKFLSQKLELWMFIPCKLVDGVWVVSEEPKEDYYFGAHGGVYPDKKKRYDIKFKEYQESKERVLFEGFYIKENIDKNGVKWTYITNSIHYFNQYQIENNTIEELLTGYKDEFMIELTPTAKKQIGLWQ